MQDDLEGSIFDFFNNFLRTLTWNYLKSQDPLVWNFFNFESWLGRWLGLAFSFFWSFDYELKLVAWFRIKNVDQIYYNDVLADIFRKRREIKGSRWKLYEIGEHFLILLICLNRPLV